MLSTIFAIASLSATILACAFYRAFTCSEHSTKQKCWVVTLLSSTLMTCGSLPFLWDFCTCGGTIRSAGPTTVLARALCGSFQGFLIADLAVGTQFYRQQVTLCFGWVHHIAYALLMPYISLRGWDSIFSLCLSMEIPTFYLSVSIIWPRWRNDLLYVILFFLFRISLHSYLLIHLRTPKYAEVLVQGSSIPSTLLALAFALHISVLAQNVKKLLVTDTGKRLAYPGRLIQRRESFSQCLSAKSWAFMFNRISLRNTPAGARIINGRRVILLAIPLIFLIMKGPYTSSLPPSRSSLDRLSFLKAKTTESLLWIFGAHSGFN